MNLLGLCRRAGALRPGVEATRAGLRSGRVRLVVMAVDASRRTRAQMERLAARASRPAVRWGSRAELGKATGLSGPAVLGVTDAGLAREIERAANIAGVDG